MIHATCKCGLSICTDQSLHACIVCTLGSQHVDQCLFQCIVLCSILALNWQVFVTCIVLGCWAKHMLYNAYLDMFLVGKKIVKFVTWINKYTG